MGRAAPLLVGGGFLFITLFALAPLLFGDSGLGMASRIVFGGLCHQMPGRSLFVDGHQAAICHRCTGIYLGLALGGFFALVRRVDPRSPRVWLLGAAPTLIQLALAVPWTFFDAWWMRLVSGALTGAAGGLLMASGLSGAPSDATPREPGRP